MLERFELLVGSKIEDIKNKNILIVGLGGVGSYTVESLIRSGIENITLVDNDKIDITNLNRQLMTNINNIGDFKTEALASRIKLINPSVNVNIKTIFLNEDNINDVVSRKYDYVVDACDTLKTKIALIKICDNLDIKLISAMGTGNKMDPSKIKITDIYKTEYDPLAKLIRKECRKLKIKKLPVVSSFEKPIKDNIKKIPSNAFVPAIAGLFITSYIINDIVGDISV